MKKGIFSLALAISLIATFAFLNTSFATAIVGEDTWELEQPSNNIRTTTGVQNVGIGAAAPNRPLTIKGTGANSEWISLRRNDDLTKWHINHKNGGLNFVETGFGDNRLFLAAGGNVGVGTATPGAKFEVAGTIKIGAFASDPPGTEGMMYYNTQARRFKCNQLGGWGDCGVPTGGLVLDGGTAPILGSVPKFTGSNSVGPGSIIDVGSLVSIAGDFSVGNGKNYKRGSATGMTGGTCPSGQVVSGLNVAGGIVTTVSCISVATSTGSGSSSGGWISGTITTELAAGKDFVGINTDGFSAPNKPLTIQGIGANSEWIALRNNGGATKWHINHKNGGLNFAETGVQDNRFFLAAGGNVGIGTPTPIAKLEIIGTTNNTLRLTTNGQTVDLYVSGSTCAPGSVPVVTIGTRILCAK